MVLLQGCIISLLTATIFGERPHDEGGLITTNPDEEVDKWLASENIASEACGCGDTACLGSYTKQAEKSGSLMQINFNSTSASSSVVQRKGSRTAKSTITLYWGPGSQLLDYRNCFLWRWTAMPVSQHTEFKIVGTKFDISKDLNEKPDFTTSSPSSYEGKPIYLCITRPMGNAADEFRKAFAGNFAGIGGFATLVMSASSIFGAGEAATAIHSLASNPSNFNADAAVDAIIDNSKVAGIKMFWSKLTRDKTIAWLTLGSCGQAPIPVKFKVVKHAVMGHAVRTEEMMEVRQLSSERYSASWENGEALTAKQLAALIVLSR